VLDTDAGLRIVGSWLRHNLDQLSRKLCAAR
jgi:hypothetical protein